MSQHEVARVVQRPEIIQMIESGDGPATTTPTANPLTTVHSLLRGRYWIAAILVVVGLGVGSFVGYRLKPPVYRSTGLVRVKPILPRVLYQSEQNGVMPMFDTFVDSQVSLLESQRVIDLAMQADEWRALNRGLSPEAVAAFSTSLEVTHGRGSEMIAVSFTDGDATVAMTAVRAVIESYNKLYGENDALSDEKIRQTLEDRRTALTNDLKAKNDQILEIAREFGSDSLEDIYNFKLQEAQKLESEFKAADLARVVAEAQSGQTAVPATLPAVAAAGTSVPAPATQPARISPELVAISDPIMRNYLVEKQDIQRRIETNKRLGEKHHSMIEARVTLALIDKQIQKQMDLHKDDLPAAAGLIGQSPRQLSVAEMRSNVESIRKLHADAHAETVDVGRKRMQISTIRADADAVRQRLKDTEARIEQLNVESPVRGRINVVSYGDRPLTPFTDKRAAFAAAGGVGLSAFGVGAVLLFGLIGRRVRHISDVHHTGAPFGRLLGVLPALPHDLSDPLQAKVASHSVHHIRSLLQSLDPHLGCRSIAITSPSPAAGKTSLTLALGLSFAASGSRTLLVDCDMVGGGLTRRISRSGQRKLGQVLRRAGLLDAMKIEFILRRARATGKRFGEAGVALRYLTPADVDYALEVQTQATVGLREVVNGESLEDCITGTGTPNLFILPLGSAQGHHVAELSANAIRRILAAASGQFNTVLIDTGPALGSIEAGMVANAVDHVVLTLSRGESRSFVERALAHLQSVQAKVAGVVFNRAHPADIVSSGYSSSVSRPSGQQRLPDVNTSVLTSHSRFGPVATAVLALGPSAEER